VIEQNTQLTVQNSDLQQRLNDLEEVSVVNNSFSTPTIFFQAEDKKVPDI